MDLPEYQPLRPRKGMLRGWIDRFLRHTHHHYRCVLPERFGPVRSHAFRLFYSGVRLEDSQPAVLRDLPADSIIVYTTRFRCSFAFLFAHTRFGSVGLPLPRIGLGARMLLWQPVSQMARILLAHADSLVREHRLPDPFGSGFFRDELLQGKAAFLTAIEKRSFWRRFRQPRVDPIEFLIDLQGSTERPVFIVPQVVFFSKKPRRALPTLADMFFGPEDDPGRLRLLAALFKNPGNVFVEISQPVGIRRFLERPDIAGRGADYQAAILRGEILAQIDRHRQSITGPVLKSREDIKERVLNSERFQQFMQAHADAQQLPLAQVRENAGSCVNEIAADISPNWIRFFSAVIGWILRTIFDGVSLNLEGLAAVKRAFLQGPVVYIPAHKSHVDYLLLSYMLYHNDLPCPLIAAGKNLSFWPLGPLFRRGGAFFIRRSFRGAVLYSRAFAEYIHTILEEGYSVAQFFEGGRSRTGKLLQPKLGLLSMLLAAQKGGACEDLIFVPVSIVYDRVLEEKSYLQEIEGGQKKPESFWQVLKARKFLSRRYGKVYLHFSEPLSANAWARLTGTSLAAMSSAQFTGYCRSLGNRIAHAINRVSVVTPHALAAAAILTCGRERFDLEELMASIEVYMGHLDPQRVKLADTLILDHRRAVTHALDSYVQRKILDSWQTDPPQAEAAEGFVLREAKRPFLEYYKNTCVAFFIPAAFTALGILQKDAFQFSAADLHTEYQFLQDLFQLEFVSDPDVPAEQLLRETLRAFIEDAVLIPHPDLPDTYNVTSAGFRKLRLFAMFLKTFFESYWVVLSYLRQTPAETGESKERVKKIAAFGSRLFKHKGIEHREALSKVTYENALEFCASRGIRGAEDREAIDTLAPAIDRALRHLKR